MSETDAAMAARNEGAGADAAAPAEAERAAQKSLDDLRDERQEQIGRRTCH
jgi:hypothetical protein